MSGTLQVGTVSGTLELEDKFSAPLKLWHSLISGGAMGAGIAAFNKVGDAVGRMIDFMPGAIAAYAHQEQAIFRLTAAMQSQGENTAANLQAYKEQADALMRLGTAGSEEILSIQKRFVMLGQEKDQVIKTTEAVVNLAHATGQDAGAVTQAFVAAARGRTNALRQFGIVVDETVPRSKRLEEAINQAAKRFEGLGGVVTFADRLKNLRLAQDEMVEGLGEGIVTSGKFTAAIDEARKLAWMLVDAINKNKDTIRSWVNTGVLWAADAIVILGKGLVYANELFTLFRSGITILGASMVSAGTVILSTWDDLRVGATDLYTKFQQVVILSKAAAEAAASPLQATKILKTAEDQVSELQAQQEAYIVAVKQAADVRATLAQQSIESSAKELLAEVAAGAGREKALESFVRKLEEMRRRIAAAADVTSPIAQHQGTKPPPLPERGFADYKKSLQDFMTELQKQTAGVRGQLLGGFSGALIPIRQQFDETVKKIDEMGKKAAEVGPGAVAEFRKQEKALTNEARAAKDLSIELAKQNFIQQNLGMTYEDVWKSIRDYDEAVKLAGGDLSQFTKGSLQQQLERLRQSQATLKENSEEWRLLEERIKKVQAALKEKPGSFLEDLQKVTSGLSQNFGALNSMLADFGIEGMKANKIIEGLGQTMSGVSDLAAGIASHNPFQAIAGGMQALGGLVKTVSGAFRDTEWEHVNDIRDAWEDSIGTFEDLSKKAAAAGVANLLPEYLAAKTEKDWETVQKKLEEGFAAQDIRDQLTKSIGGMDALKEKAAELKISLQGLFDARTQRDAEEYVANFQELVDLQGQLKDIATDAVGKLADSLSSAVDMSAYQRKLLTDAYTSGQLSAEQFDEGMKAVKENGIQILTPEDAQSQAAIAMMAFTEEVKQDGLVSAADAFKPVAEALRLNLTAAGVDADALLGPMFSQIALASNNSFRTAVEGAQGLSQTLRAFRAEEMPLTVEQLGAFGQQAQSAFAQATAGGANTEQALTAIAPLLAQLQSASQQYGVTLDANTQNLLDQAKAAGIAFPTDPIDRMVAAIDRLVKVLGGDIPAAADAAGKSIADALATAQSFQAQGLDLAQATGSYYGPMTATPMAEGGVITRPTLVMAGETEPEAFVPLSQFGSLGGSGMSDSAMQALFARFERSITKSLKTAIQQAGR
jgi:hypothetical protein